MFYWRLKVSVPGGYSVYIKTHRRYIDAMLIDLAVKHGDLLDVFAQYVNEVKEITKEEYFEEMCE